MIDTNVFLGFGARSILGVTVCALSNEGAGSTVIRHPLWNVSAGGTPAKVVRVRDESWQRD